MLARRDDPATNRWSHPGWRLRRPGGAPSGRCVDTPDATDTIWDPATASGEGFDPTRRGSRRVVGLAGGDRRSGGGLALLGRVRVVGRLGLRVVGFARGRGRRAAAA